MIKRLLCPEEEDKGAAWRMLMALEIWDAADKTSLAGARSPFLHFSERADAGFVESCLFHFSRLPVRYVGQDQLPTLRREWDPERQIFALVRPAELLLNGKDLEFFDNKGDTPRWRRLHKLTVKMAYKLLWDAHLRSLPDYKSCYATACVPPRPKADSPAALSYPFRAVKKKSIKARWRWLASLAVAPKVRQFLFLKWHGKLYLGATGAREATCRFLQRDESTPCGQKDSIEHFSVRCPTAQVAIGHLAYCWVKHWDQPEATIKNAIGPDYAGESAASLAPSLLSWSLWRARSISSCSGEKGRLVGASSIIAEWRYQLTTTLEDMCRVRSSNLREYTLGGHWLNTINEEKNIYEVVISFPSIPEEVSESSSESEAASSC